MIFRDLIQPEEFYDGCDVYESDCTSRSLTLKPNREDTCGGLYIWTIGYFTYTETGMHVNVTDDLRNIKEVLCNCAFRIIPTKYKPL